MAIIIDVVLVALLLLVILLGIFRGFLKSSFGLVYCACFLVSVVFLMPLIINKLAEFGWMQKFGNTIGKLFAKIGGGMGVQVAQGQDVATTLTEAGPLAALCTSLVTRGLANGRASVSAADMLGLYVLKFILGIVVVLLLAFVIRRLLKLIIWALKKLHKVKFFKILDRFLGFIYCLGMTAAIFLLVFGELKLFSRRIPAVDNALKETKITKIVYEKNPLQGFINKHLNIEKMISSFKK